MAIIVKDIVTWMKNWFYTKSQVDSKLTTRNINEDTALPNLEVLASSNQHEINLAIDEKIGQGGGGSGGGVSLACVSDFTIDLSDPDDVELELYACTGKIISEVAQTGTVGLVDNYTIYYNDGSTYSFQVTNGSDASVDIVTSWSSTTSNSKVPSEKLTKDSLDGKANSTHSHTTSDISNFPSLSTVATTGSYSDLSNKPSIPSASSTTPSADTTNGSVGSGTAYARSNHTHPKSSLYAESSHTHTKSQITDFPTIPTKTSDLTNDGADGTNVFVSNNDSRLSDSRTPTNHSHGNLSDDGKISTTSSANMVYFCGVGSSANTLYKSNKLSSACLIDGTAHSNLGTSANASQSTINSAIDTLIGQAISYINQ